jgi:hypothetical protein
MSIAINYHKRKNNGIFNKFQTNKHMLLSNIQNYLPIYDRFFTLNQTNFNSINLNNDWFITDINDKNKNKNKNKKNDKNDKNDKNETDANIFNCKIRHVSDDELTDNQSVFIKIAPLLDPFKYLVGKYNHTDNNLFNLPSIDKSKDVHNKIQNCNNSAYIDGFFSFLSSKTLHEHKFIHGIDYYGSFLAIKNEYKLNVIDDIEYLVKSDFFNKQKDVLFTVEDYSAFLVDDIIKPLKPLNIEPNVSIELNDHITTIEELEIAVEVDIKHIDLNDMQNMNIDLVDITSSNQFNVNELKKSESLKSGSSCSSRTSHTNDEDDDITETTISNNSNENEEEWSDIDTDESSLLGEEPLYAIFPQFPVQVICMEQCDNTFDYLIDNGLLNENEWFSALMQVIMTLITYQKMFSFTHNDLHTNNIMYVSTNKKFIYYCYNKKYYKVPTYGKMYKIIDFGRAIYKFSGKTFCSDSFQIGGDASTQYNTEPFFNENKPRLEPNMSFDLCRLACSIFDYIVDDLDEIKNIDECEPIVKLINEWCLDDNGRNVLYKTNGNERYPDFKLYKMIARCVHKHTPQSQLDRPEFSKFIIPNSPKGEQIFNIDTLPSYI